MTKETDLKKSMVDQFIESTPQWYKEMAFLAPPDKPCMICGIIPFNMAELIKEVKVLKEKAWMYDELCK